jgi:hypothetical protein
LRALWTGATSATLVISGCAGIDTHWSRYGLRTAAFDLECPAEKIKSTPMSLRSGYRGGRSTVVEAMGCGRQAMYSPKDGAGREWGTAIIWESNVETLWSRYGGPRQAALDLECAVDKIEVTVALRRERFHYGCLDSLVVARGCGKYAIYKCGLDDWTLVPEDGVFRGK